VKKISEMTQSELGAFIQTHLRESGIDVVLSGGAAVGIHSVGEYVSQDLDMVNCYFKKRSAIRKCMEELGFIEKARYFTHPDTEYLVEFPPGPLTVGDESVKQVDEIQFSTGVLRVISPTDCVKDRLAAYYHWGDRQGLTQAILVARRNEIDINELERWSAVEGKQYMFEQIKDEFAGEKK
jgi:hypothetical protein